MVQVQIQIEQDKENKKFLISCFLLRREDATDTEFNIAKACEGLYREFVKGISEKLKMQIIKQTEIKDK
jgi:hypothetical protein